MNNGLLTKKDFEDYKHMFFGPNVIVVPSSRGLIQIRVVTGVCSNWNCNADNLVSLNLSEYQFDVDALVFCIYNEETRSNHIVGWILFDELLKRGEVLEEDGIVHLTIPINSLEKPDTLNKLPEKSLNGS